MIRNFLFGKPATNRCALCNSENTDCPVCQGKPLVFDLDELCPQHAPNRTIKNTEMFASPLFNINDLGEEKGPKKAQNSHLGENFSTPLFL